MSASLSILLSTDWRTDSCTKAQLASEAGCLLNISTIPLSRFKLPAPNLSPCAADAAGLSIVDIAVITNPGEILGGGIIILTIKEGNYLLTSVTV